MALSALRHGDLRAVRAVGHSEVLRLLAKRNTGIGGHRTWLVARMHALLVELARGGLAKEINASDVDVFLGRLSPATPVEHVRYELAVELMDDIGRLDAELKASHKRIESREPAWPALIPTHRLFGGITADPTTTLRAPTRAGRPCGAPNRLEHPS